MYRIILLAILALGLSTITSYPPNLPVGVIQSYDYPIVRLLVLGGIFYTAIHLPDLAILLAIVYAILADDIVKTSSKVKEMPEGFSDFQMINLLPGASDVQEANIVSEKKMVSLDMVKDTIQRLESQIADLSRNHK
jgi:hypothetical protein